MLKAQWRQRPPISDPIHVHILINKHKKYPDDINILETIYDCLESAGIIKNDNLITEWSGSSEIDKKKPISIKIEISPKDE